MFYFRSRWIALVVLTLLLQTPGLRASQEDEAANAAAEATEQAERAELEARYQDALQAAEAERARAEQSLERARAEMAAVARARAQQEAELGQARQQRDQELARMREELSRSHNELRKASREVARAYREIGRESAPQVRMANLGDRAVIGVILGETTDTGVQVIGVSPDGPAERAGVQQGDVIIGMRGQNLVDSNETSSPRAAVYEVMSGVEDGEELQLTLERNDGVIDVFVVAEKREPLVWQSVVRLPSAPHAPDGHPAAVPGVARIVIEDIQIPEIDHEALAEQVEKITREVKQRHIVVTGDDASFAHAPEHDAEYSFEIHSISDFGDDALHEANLWFGLPAASGLELTAINPGLGEYFNTDKGVLVLKAREDNGLQLKSGDVVLSVGDATVEKPADLMRALRDLDTGSEVEIKIKRNKRNRTLDVVMPENRLGFVEPYFKSYSFNTRHKD
jgi:C-terminal processing protease CtpA/Prc